MTLTPASLVDVITPPPPTTPTPPTTLPPTTTPAPTTRPNFGIVGTTNQRSVAAGFDRAVARGANVSAFFPLYNLPAAQLPRGLDQFSGQVHTAGSRTCVALTSTRLVTPAPKLPVVSTVAKLPFTAFAWISV